MICDLTDGWRFSPPDRLLDLLVRVLLRSEVLDAAGLAQERGLPVPAAYKGDTFLSWDLGAIHRTFRQLLRSFNFMAKSVRHYACDPFFPFCADLSPDDPLSPSHLIYWI